MTNSVIPFLFNANEIRTIVKDDAAWFVASDIAKALEYQTTEKMTRILDADEADTHIMGIRSENGVIQNREVTIINESGMYHAIFKSRKQKAVEFRKWVTGEVLPTIRKTGTYTAPQPERKTLTPEQQRFVQKAVTAKVKKTGEHWNTIYHNIKDVFNVGTYTDIKQDSFPALCEYLGVVYSGEFIAATDAPKAIEAPSIPEGKMLVDKQSYQDMERMITLHRERLALLDKANSEMQHAYNLAKVVIEGHMNNAMQAVRTANTYLYDPIREAHTALRMSVI